MSKYIVRLEYFNFYSVAFLGTGTFIFQGEKHAVLCRADRAKRYSTYKRAENAVRNLIKSCVNVPDDYTILEVQE